MACGGIVVVTGMLVWHRYIRPKLPNAATASARLTAAERRGGSTRAVSSQRQHDAARAAVALEAQQRSSQFDAALSSTLATLQAGRTNITEEEIARIFSGLHDPTHIVDVIEPYLRGATPEERSVARRCFEYMLQHYKEERLQACAHNALARLLYREALENGAFNEDLFDESVAHYEAVLAMPSKQYWYLISLDMLGMSYMVAGNVTGRYDDYHAKALHAFRRLYEEADQVFMRENALCFILRCLRTREEKRAFYAAYKDVFTIAQYKDDFEEQATYQQLKEDGN